MGELNYFPAGNQLGVSPAKRMENALFNVPDDACSPSAISYTVKMLTVLRIRRTIIDSGGFQILMFEENGKKISFDGRKPVIRNEYELNLAPDHIVDAATILKPDFFVGLDFPIRKLKSPSKQDFEFEFMRKVGFNAIFARQCHDLRMKKCPNILFFIPIQCYNLIQLDQYMQMIHGVTYDGFSIPVRNLSSGQIILFLIRFYQMGVRRVHILGTATIVNIAMAAFMARHLFDWVSIDATTWRKRAEYTDYLNPHTLKPERIAQNVIIDENIPMDCECPFCRGKTFTFIKNLPDTERTGFLRSHNWWITEKASRDLFEASDTTFALKRCLHTRGVDKESIDQLCDDLSKAYALRDCDIEILRSQLDYKITERESLRREAKKTVRARKAVKKKKGKTNHGTQEWAVRTFNCCTGCSHDCLYCYGKDMAIRFKRVAPGQWAHEQIRPKDVSKRHKKYDGQVMFPSSHDITPNNLDSCKGVLEKLLASGNQVLVVSKPHFVCIQEICDGFQKYADQILFRFTIGACDDQILSYWEPGAPCYEERKACLEYAYNAKFRTSVSVEPMLASANIDTLINELSPYVTHSIWIGTLNHSNRFGKEADDILKQAIKNVELGQTDDALKAIYKRYKDNPLIRWKKEIKKVVGIPIPKKNGLDI